MRTIALALKVLGWVTRPVVFLFILAIVVFVTLFEQLVVMGQLSQCWKESGDLTDFSAFDDPTDHPVL